jgi:energy-coupling factor transport system permease protein
MNGISRWHPAVLLVYFLAVLFISVFCADPLLAVLAFCGGAAACMITGCIKHPKDYVWYALAAMLIAVTNPLFSHLGETVLFRVFGMPYTLEALVFGAVSGVSLAAALLWCRCLSVVMTEEKWFALFGRMAPRLALALTMAMRFVPLLSRQAKRVLLAQRAIGLHDTTSHRARLRSAGRLLTALVGWATDRALDTARSMQARGYGLAGRTAYVRHRFCAVDGAVLAVCIVLIVMTVGGLLSGACDFVFYPRLHAADISAAAGAYAAFAVLVHLPLIVMIKERLQWRYYRSKI